MIRVWSRVLTCAGVASCAYGIAGMAQTSPDRAALAALVLFVVVLVGIVVSEL